MLSKISLTFHFITTSLAVVHSLFLLFTCEFCGEILLFDDVSTCMFKLFILCFCNYTVRFYGPSQFTLAFLETTMCSYAEFSTVLYSAKQSTTLNRVKSFLTYQTRAAEYRGCPEKNKPQFLLNFSG